MEAQRWRQTGRGQLGYMLICLISVNLLHAGHSVPAHRLTCVCVSVCWGVGGCTQVLLAHADSYPARCGGTIRFGLHGSSDGPRQCDEGARVRWSF